MYRLLTTHMTEKQYAVYSLSINVSLGLLFMFYYWIRHGISRFQPGMPTSIQRQTNIYAVVSTLLLLSTAVGITAFFPDINLYIAAFICIISVSNGFFDLSQTFRVARGNASGFAIWSICRSVLSFMLVFGAIQINSGPSSVLLALSVAIFSVSVFSAISDSVGQSASRAHVEKFLEYSLPLALAGGLGIAQISVGRWIAVSVLGLDSAGLYSAGLDLALQISGFITASVAAVVCPMVFRVYRNNSDEMLHIALLRSCELVFAVVIPAAVGLCVIAVPLSQILAGTRFAPIIGLVLPIFAIGRAIDAISTSYVHLSFQLAQRPLLQVVCAAVGLVVHILTGFILCLRFGIVGGAIALLITDVVVFLVGVWLMRFGLALPWPFGRLFRILLSSVLMGLVASAATQYGQDPVAKVILGVILGILSYMIFCVAFDISDVRAIVLNWLRKFTRLFNLSVG